MGILWIMYGIYCVPIVFVPLPALLWESDSAAVGLAHHGLLEQKDMERIWKTHENDWTWQLIDEWSSLCYNTIAVNNVNNINKYVYIYTQIWQSLVTFCTLTTNCTMAKLQNSQTWEHHTTAPPTTAAPGILTQRKVEFEGWMTNRGPDSSFTFRDIR